jgi:hypothetical protein
MHHSHFGKSGVRVFGASLSRAGFGPGAEAIQPLDALLCAGKSPEPA